MAGLAAAWATRASPLDTALVLRALAALGRPPGPAVRRAFSRLASLGLPSGGWPASGRSQDVSTVATAHVLLAAQDWSALPEAQALMASGIAALLTRRNVDNGFGESPSTPYATALALQVLSRTGGFDTESAQASAWLQRHQLTDGSWDGSVYSTALVLAAIQGAEPNLVVPPDSLSFDPPAPNEGDVVTVSARVRNAGRRAAGPSVAQLFEGDPARSTSLGEAQVPALAVGESAEVTFELDTQGRPGPRSIYVVADATRLVAESREDDNATSRVLTVKGLLPDLTISPADIRVLPYPPEEGETVQIGVTVRNLGPGRSGACQLRVVRGGSLGARLLGSPILPALEPSGAITITLPWDTTGQGGDHTLSAWADAAFQVYEFDELNNEASVPVHVTAPGEDSVDLEVTQVAAVPGTLTTLPQSVEVHALVRNLGHESETSTAALFEGSSPYGSQVASQPIDLAGRSSTSIVFPLSIASPGERRYYVKVDPGNEIWESNEANNEGTTALYDPANSVDLEILAGEASVSPADVIEGAVVQVTAVVHNRGTATVESVPVILAHVAAAGFTELARTDVTLEPGGTQTLTLSWRASITGDPLVLSLRADPFDAFAEVSESNNAVPLSLLVRSSNLPNLVINSNDIALNPEIPRAGQAVVILATVRNRGTVDAPATLVRAFRGDPTAGGTLIGEVPLSALPGSASTTVEIPWLPVSVEARETLVVVVDPLGAVAELDETDNQALRIFVARRLPDLVVTGGDLSLEPRLPRAGQAVTLGVTIRNLGDQAAAAFQIRAYEGEPGTGALIGEVSAPSIEANQVTNLSVSWTPSGTNADRTVSVVVDPTNAIQEVDEGNNFARRPLLIQNDDLYVTEAYFSPNGDGVQDETAIGFRSDVPTKAVVLNSRKEVVRSLTDEWQTSGAASWDGRNDQGRLLWDGKYTLALQDESGDYRGQVEVVLDTNRLPIHEAAGTKWTAVRDLTLRLGNTWPGNWGGVLFEQGYLGPAPLPAGQGALIIAPSPSSTRPAGLIRLHADGEYEYVIQPPAGGGFVWSFAGKDPVSPDGREALLIRDRTCYSPNSYCFPGDLAAVDLMTGTLRIVESLESASTQWVGPVGASWSPNGRWIAVPRMMAVNLGGAGMGYYGQGVRFYSRDGSEVGRTGAVGPISTADANFLWSPDGDAILAANRLTYARWDGTEGTIDDAPVRDLLAEVAGGWRKLGQDWRQDGKIVSLWRSDYASEGIVHDPETQTAKQVPWLPYAWSPDWNEIAWSPNGTKAIKRDSARLGWDYSYYYSVVAEDGSSEALLLPASIANRQPELRLPRDASMGVFLGAWEGSPGRAHALVNYLNLTAELRADLLPAGSGLTVTGTATDRYLSHYQLDYALASEPDTWHPITPAVEAPALDETLAVWVPPAPGTYHLRLTAGDLAGNVATKTRMVFWAPIDLPPISSISQSDTLISPNGDGVKDTVTFHYVVSQPTRVDVRVLAGETLVWSLAREAGEVGPTSFTWQGRDSLNRVVPDGSYTVLINGLEYPVAVDNTPPDIAWSYDNLRVEGGELIVDRLWHVVDAHLASWFGPGQEIGQDPVVEVERDENGRIIFENGAPKVLYEDGHAANLRQRDPKAIELGTVPWQFSAQDRAGNRSVVAVGVISERLAILGALNVRTGRAVLVGPVRFDPESPYALAWQTSVSLDHTMTDRYRGRKPDSVRFEYRPIAGGSGPSSGDMPGSKGIRFCSTSWGRARSELCTRAASSPATLGACSALRSLRSSCARIPSPLGFARCRRDPTNAMRSSRRWPSPRRIRLSRRLCTSKRDPACWPTSRDASLLPWQWSRCHRPSSR